MICPNCGKETSFSEICLHCGEKTEFTRRTNHQSVGHAHHIISPSVHRPSSLLNSVDENTALTTRELYSANARMKKELHKLMQELTITKKLHQRWLVCLLVVGLVSGLIMGASGMYLWGIASLRSSPEVQSEPTEVVQETIPTLKEEPTPVLITFDLNPSEEMWPHMKGIYPPPTQHTTEELPYVCNINDWFFVGWNTEPDGSGVFFRYGETISEQVMSSTTLFAQWNPFPSVIHQGEETQSSQETADVHASMQESHSENVDEMIDASQIEDIANNPNPQPQEHDAK